MPRRLPWNLTLLLLLGAAPALSTILSIPPAAFMDDEANRTTMLGGQYVLATFVSEGNAGTHGNPYWGPCADAPLLLPHGSEIVYLGMWAHDEVPGEDLVLRLHRKPVGGGPSELLASVATIGDNYHGFPTQSVSHVFDRQGYVYWLRACFGTVLSYPWARLDLYSVVLEYVGPGMDLESRSPVSLHPAAFRESSGRQEAVHDFGGGFVHSIWGQQERLIAPLQLPEGAEILRLEVTAANPSGNGFGVNLYRKRLNNLSGAELLGAVAITGVVPSPEKYVDESFTAPVVSSTYHYFLAAEDLNGIDGQRIYDVEIVHTDPLFADGFESGDTSSWAPQSSIESMVISSTAFRSAWSNVSAANPPMAPYLTNYFDLALGILHLHPPPDEAFLEAMAFCAIAPLVLPHEAEIVGWTVWGYDADPSLDMTVELRTKTTSLLAPDPTIVLSSITSSSDPGNFGIFLPLSHPVENLAHQLTINWCQHEDAQPGDFGLIGIEVFYKP